ncbi:MAG: sulfatase-like hydrolase/transferase [Actinomycetota bacterium]
MLRRLLAITGLTGLVVAQPLLDLFGGSPATFQIHGVEGRAVLLFAAVVIVVPPLVIWLLGEAVRVALGPRGEVVHLITVAILLGIFGILLAKAITSLAVITIAVGMVVGIGGAVLYRDREPVRLWLQLVAAANVLFFVQFAFYAPVAEWIESATNTPDVIAPEFIGSDGGADGQDESARDEAAALPSVFMLVFDEFPTGSVLGEQGTIDPVRFPNLAALADDATFHRRFTTISPFTQSAVPSLLDGKLPAGEPTWTDHPENLFNVFAFSHHLIVSEFLTNLCGFDTCGDAPIPPPPPVVAPDDPVADEPEPAPAPPVSDDGANWGDLVSDAWDVWVDRVSPGRGDATQTFDDFREDLTPTDEPSAPAPDPEPADAATTTAPEPSTTEPGDDGLTEEERQLERFFDLLTTNQPGRFAEWRDAIQPSDQPMFGYLHLVLPHQPWVLREDGTEYDVAAGRYDFEADHSDPWTVQLGRQRHLLQTQYADRLVGLLVEHLTELGIYDQSMIVVLGDHGVAFQPGQSSRSITDDNLFEIAYTPLLIKAPGQTEGVLDDQNLTSMDLAPTIADLLGLRLPWETDGFAAGSPEIAARGADKEIYDWTDAFDYTFRGIIDFDDSVGWASLIENLPPALTLDDDPIAGLYRDLPGSEFLGGSADDLFTEADGVAEVAALDRLRVPGDAPLLLGEVAGRVPGTPDDAHVLVAVNGEVVGVSPLYVRQSDDDSFAVLLPADALRPDANDIRVAVLTADGRILERALPG